MNANFPTQIKGAWPNIKTVIRVEGSRKTKRETTESTRYYVSSLAMNAQEAAQNIRHHWLIENELHWVLDVVFREDDLKVKDPTGAKHLALFNRVALNIFKQHPSKDGIATKRRKACWNPKFRSELIMG